MKDTEGRWLRRLSSIDIDLTKTKTKTKASFASNSEGQAVGGTSPLPRSSAASEMTRRIRTTAFAFRGFDVENLGRSVEFLDHPVFGPIVGRVLAEASELCSDSTHQAVDLALHIRAGAKTSLEVFPQDVATIVAMELAQMTILESCFGVPARQAQLSFGYSIGELSGWSGAMFIRWISSCRSPWRSPSIAPSWPPT